MTFPPKTVALAMKVFPVMVFPILLNATPLPDGERPTYNYIPKSNLKTKVLDCWQPAKMAHIETREIRGRIEVW